MNNKEDGMTDKIKSNPLQENVLAKAKKKMAAFMGGLKWEPFFSVVSVVGLRYVALKETPLARRLMWMALVLAGAGFMFFQVSLLLYS